MSIEHAKNAAARAALAAYVEPLAKLLEEQGAPVESVTLHGTRHVHQALLVDPGTREAVAIRVEWTFSSDAEVIAAAVASGRPAGIG